MSREGERLLRPKEVAERLQVSVRMVQRLAQSRDLPPVLFGRALRFRPKEVERFIERHQMPARKSGKLTVFEREK